MKKNQFLIFDFDGTLYRGDAPYVFYAQEVSKAMHDDSVDEYLTRVAQFLNSTEHPPTSVCDNWQAVVHFAEPYVTDRNALQHAFNETRKYMMQDECTLQIPKGLEERLMSWREHATLLLASNSPEDAAIPLLRKLGLHDAFHVVRHSACKPDGLLPVLEDIGTLPDKYACASIGDNYINDIAPAVAAGWSTVHISPRGAFSGPSTLQVRTLEDAYDWIDAWVQHGD